MDTKGEITMTMKRILTAAFCAAVLLGAAFVVRAQGSAFHHRMGSPDDMARHEEFMAKALDLTAEQKAAAQKIHTEVAAKAKPLMEQARQQWEEIHALLEKDNPDPTEIGQRVIAAHATREQLEALHQDAMTKFSALLNADQLAKFKQFQEMHHEHEGFDFRR
jgi:Spy/CpxP family protein refolding chaperone